MKLNFASWNINYRNFTSKHLDFINSTDCDVIALQECKQSFFDDLKQKKLFSFGDFSLVLHPPPAEGGKSRNLGCAIFSKHKIKTSFVIQEVAFPERTLVTQCKFGESLIQFCSFHIPPGSSWGKIKPQTFKILAKWLKAQKNRMVLGIDANAPKSDKINIAENEWWWKDEPVFLGAKPEHHLEDVFRKFLNRTPEKLEEIQKLRPDGPLAVSYIRGNKRKYTPSRYDFIYATKDIGVINVKYLYDEAIEAGSDHALVLAELEC